MITVQIPVKKFEILIDHLVGNVGVNNYFLKFLQVLQILKIRKNSIFQRFDLIFAKAPRNKVKIKKRPNCKILNIYFLSTYN